MLRPSTLVSALALVTSTYAQSSAQQAQEEVVSVLAIGTAGDQQNLFASVVDNDATATTLKIGCDRAANAEVTESVLCNLFSGFDVIVGPSTFAAGYEYNSGTMTIACAVTGTTTASCKQTVIRPVDDMDPNAGGESGGGDEQENFSTVSGTDTGLVTEALETTLAASDMTFYPVTITAGSLKSGGGGGGEGSSTTSGTAGSSAAGASGSGESANASGGGGSGSSGGAGQLVLEVVSVVAAGSIALLMVML